MFHVDHLRLRAQEILSDFKTSHPETASPTRKALISFFESKYSPLVVVPRRYGYQDSYLVPIKTDSPPFLDTKSAPGDDKLTPYRVNPLLLPSAAKLQAVLYNIDDQPVQTTRAPSPAEEPPSDNVEPLFTFSLDAGPAEETCNEEVEHDKEVQHQELASTAQFELSRKGDLRAFVNSCAGLPIVLDEAQKASGAEATPTSSYRTIGFTNLQQKKLSVPVLDTKSQAIRKLVKQQNLTATTLNDRKAAAAAEELRKHNHLDKWFGMKRKVITPEIRAELKAIDLRGFTDVKRRYRGTKRQMALSKAESGFFEIGVVRNGGIEDSGVSADGLLKSDSKRRRTKSLVKSLLKESGI